jgi:hypothetical protein
MAWDSFDEYVAWNKAQPDHRSQAMHRDFYGADSMSEVYELATAGLPREGIKALELSAQDMEQRDRELVSQQFQTVWNVEGADVDVARFLDGEPECMLDYHMADHAQQQRVATLVISGAVHCGISTKAIRTHGQRLMAMVEAIDSTGLQTEVWLDVTVSSDHSDNTARLAVRLRAPGELLDAGMFMFALTHASMLRGLGFNAMHQFPAKFRKSAHIPGYYGFPVNTAKHLDDYPDGAIYIPSISRDDDAGKAVDATLRKLGLLS